MFDTFERSRFTGRPVHLFVFTRQGLTWRYSTADHNRVFGDGQPYLAAQIQRSEIKQTAERAKDKIKIKLAYLRDPFASTYPSTQPLGSNWHPFPPGDPVFVQCLSTHLGDEDPPVVEWTGIVTQPVFSDTELELTCEQTSAIDQAVDQGPRWGRACWKAVYSTGIRGCNLALDAFRVDAELDEVDGLVLTATEFASAPLSLLGGWIEWTRGDGLVEKRGITAHDGDSITILYGGIDLAEGLEVIARPNCPGTWSACEERENTINFGGAIYKPVRDPNEESMSWG